MDWSKVDAGLAAALADAEAGDRYVVFVHLARPVDPGVADRLPCATTGNDAVRTATVSTADVERLSDRPEVSQIRLSRALGLAEPT